MGRAFLILGSNLGDRRTNINLAISEITLKVGKITAYSSVYETEAWGTNDPLPFLNQVISVETGLSPDDLLQKLLNIEQLLGRKRTGVLNQPRIIDIDILLFGDQIVKTESLTIPHERMHLRKFVLVPLAEIAPSEIHPLFKKSFTELLTECNDSSWVRKV
ncbi:MAG TPA: 2-amino-4-hydroxy-6-hydroxymethyldihydropteridine diphosphokinase [Lentimicrobium sp.]|nr:2-amino-4-hydroxy-6-hydroxymethyldihydropteridine diphosphokinase [Lentimicrobium sp.]